jgi:hypothetical protein
MPDQSAQRRALRLLDEEIIRIETEILPQLTATSAPFDTHWQAYVTYARLLPARLQLQQLYEERRRLRTELQG